MNIKLFLKLGLFLLSLSLVSCGQKFNSAVEDNSYKASVSQSVSNNQRSGEESINTTSPSVENEVETKLKDKDIKPDTQEDRQQDTQQDATKNEYYIIIKEAWQRQKEYIDSIDDSTIKQSIQTPESAAIMESNGLLIKHPEESETIDASLKRVLNGE
jgi:hypothetical protein